MTVQELDKIKDLTILYWTDREDWYCYYDDYIKIQDEGNIPLIILSLKNSKGLQERDVYVIKSYSDNKKFDFNKLYDLSKDINYYKDKYFIKMNTKEELLAHLKVISIQREKEIIEQEFS